MNTTLPDKKLSKENASGEYYASSGKQRYRTMNYTASGKHPQ
jgi:hypothetical protein